MNNNQKLAVVLLLLQQAHKLIADMMAEDKAEEKPKADDNTLQISVTENIGAVEQLSGGG